VVVQFERWLLLRARIEQAWLRGDTAQIYPGCPDSSLLIPDSSYVMCDGPYIAHVRDPGTAPPNLARVQEMAAGIWRTQTSAVSELVGLRLRSAPHPAGEWRRRALAARPGVAVRIIQQRRHAHLAVRGERLELRPESGLHESPQCGDCARGWRGAARQSFAHP